MKSLKFFAALFAVVALMLIIKCKKNDACTTPATPTAVSNTPVAAGNTILLSTLSVAGASYSWTGPNGYSSNFQNAAIPSATAAMAGTYYLKITVSGCTSAAATTVVAVNNNCTPPATPSAASNSPVVAKSALNLTTPAVTGATYSWTGPNGFTSALQNPTITSATPAMSGIYYVTINVNSCTSAPGSTIVAVDTAGSPAFPSCTPPSNTAQYSGLPDLQFYAISGSTNTGNYEIIGNSANGDLYIDFPTTALPIDTVYSISSDCPGSFLGARQVCVSTVTGGVYSTYFIPTSGNVYVTNSGGKVTVIFCGLTFNGNLGGNNISFTGSAKITTQ